MSDKLPPGQTILLGQAAELDANRPSLVRQVEHIKRVKGGRGYLLSDNRVSGGTLEECATLTCAHCNAVVVLNPQRQRPREYCRKCHAYVCDQPGCRLDCFPLSAVIELAQRHPDQNWLERGPNGEPRYDERLRDRAKIY